MNTQNFTGDTATQTTGTIPYESAEKLRYNYYWQKANNKKSISVPDDLYENFEKTKNSQKASLTEPLLELEPEASEIPPKVIKKHNLNIYPEMDEEDYSALKSDIQQNGYDPKYPIWLYQGDILDGWNRQKICAELNIRPVYQNFIGNDSDALAFVVRSNNRRNLTPIQRACIALDYTPIFDKFKKEAKERQIEGGKNKVRQKFAQPIKDDNKTDTKVAKLFNTNRTYIQKARKIKNENPDMFDKIKSGEETIKKTNIKAIFTGDNEWYTPKEYIEKVRKVLGSIDVDPASSDFAQETVQATTYYTITINGLNKNWNGNVFMNPPYSTAEVVAFINKFIEEYTLGNVKQGIILTNNSTDTDWFHKLMKIAQLACFTDGRVKFYHQEKKPNITHGQIFFYVGNSEDKFIEEFTEVGSILRKV